MEAQREGNVVRLAHDDIAARRQACREMFQELCEENAGGAIVVADYGAGRFALHLAGLDECEALMLLERAKALLVEGVFEGE